MHKVIGEGTYGCVVKPGLKCKENINIRGRLSKLMSLKSAKDELNEMQILSSIPGIEKYAIEMPTLCTPIKSKAFRDSFDTTKPEFCSGEDLLRSKLEDDRHNINTNEASLYQDKVSSLLIEDGGVDLYKLVTEPGLLTETNLRPFLTATVKLIEGLQFFRNNDVIHRDIKLGNIVYNTSTEVIKYIDFGMASKLSILTNETINNANQWGRSHSYWPKENSCANKKNFTKKAKCRKYRNKMSWQTFNEKSVYSFDLYCLSYAFSDLFDKLQSSNHIHMYINEEFQSLFKEYCHPELSLRSINIDDFLLLYTKLLVKYNLFESRSSSLSKKSVPPSTRSYPKRNSVSSKKSKKRKFVPCPEGMYRNHLTNRCKKRATKKKK